MSFPDNAASSQRSLVDGLNDSIRENPLGAGLIGLGVLWMLLGSKRVSALGGAIPGAVGAAAGSVGSAAAAGGHSIASGFSAAGSHIKDASQWAKEGMAQPFTRNAEPLEAEPTRLDAADVEASTMSARADRARAAGDGARAYAQSGWDYGNSLTEKLGDGLQKQPLLLGALGLAIGAGIASAFPSTRMEGDLMGEHSAAAREKMHEAADELKGYASSTANQVLEDVKDEAVARGLTPGAAKEALQDIADKTSKVAASARKSFGYNT